MDNETSTIGMVANFTTIKSTRCFGRIIATEPFEQKSVEKRAIVKIGNAQLSGIVQKTSLTALKVIFGNDQIQSGSTVYILGDRYLAPWGQKEYDLDDKKFILVPESEVLLVTL